MKKKIRICDLREGHIIDFASVPSMAAYAYAFGKVEGRYGHEGQPAVGDDGIADIEHWGEVEMGDDPRAEVEVLSTEEMWAKITALADLMDNWPSDGWANAADDGSWKGPKTQQLTWCHQYGEPGYDYPKRGILFGNWNYVSRKVCDWLEELGYALEWIDEWTQIDGKAYRTSPTSYDWTPSYATDHEGNEYTRENRNGLIEALAMTDEGQPPGLLPDWVTDAELQEEGFVKVEGDDRENGFFPGQADTPEKDAKPLFDKGAKAVVFRRTEQSQFYCKWDVWVKWPLVAETFQAALRGGGIEYGYTFKEPGCDDTLFDLVLGCAGSKDAAALTANLQQYRWAADAIVEAAKGKL